MASFPLAFFKMLVLLGLLHWESAQAGCDDGWDGFNGFCYKTVIPPNPPTLDRAAAINLCKQYGAQLASVHGDPENIVVKQNMLKTLNGARYHVWLGLDIQRIDTQLIGTSWLDGTKVDYANAQWVPGRLPWAPGEPNDSGLARPAHENCLQMYGQGHLSGYWNDVSCTQTVITNGQLSDGSAAMCKKKGTPPNLSEQLIKDECGSGGNCPNGWSEYQGNCYKTVIPDNPLLLDHAGAVAECKRRRAKLASVNSDPENIFVKQLVMSTLNNGGPNYQNAQHLPRYHIWLGLNLNREFPGWGINSFSWDDGTTVGYGNPNMGSRIPWPPGEPNDSGLSFGGHENCVQMYGQGPVTGYWNDISCYQSYISNGQISDGSAAMCKKPVGCKSGGGGGGGGGGEEGDCAGVRIGDVCIVWENIGVLWDDLLKLLMNWIGGPDDWIYWITVSPSPVSSDSDNADSYCRQFGAKLVSTKNDFVNKLIDAYMDKLGLASKKSIIVCRRKKGVKPKYPKFDIVLLKVLGWTPGTGDLSDYLINIFVLPGISSAGDSEIGKNFCKLLNAHYVKMKKSEASGGLKKLLKEMGGLEWDNVVVCKRPKPDGDDNGGGGEGGDVEIELVPVTVPPEKERPEGDEYLGKGEGGGGTEVKIDGQSYYLFVFTGAVEGITTDQLNGRCATKPGLVLTNLNDEPQKVQDKINKALAGIPGDKKFVLCKKS